MKLLSQTIITISALFLFTFIGSSNVFAQNPPLDACIPTQPPPACNATCTPGGTSCPQDCPNCTSGAGGYTCKSVPTCNSDCTTPADCNGARNGCTSCVNNKCQVAPTATPTPTSTPSPTSTPTPTPDPFNEDMCKCDGLETTTTIQPDQPITITAFGKVLATDDRYAKISTIKFALLKGNGNIVEKILETDPIPAQKVASAADIVRYSASWTFDIPQPVEKGVEYRITTNTKCAKNTAAVSRPATRQVAAAQDENRGFFGAITNFFAGLFGGGSSQNNVAADQEANATPTTSQGDQIKLGTFEPMKSTVLENNNCNLMRFKFEPI